LPGVVDDARLEELYASCRFTVYPSLHEGFGLPVAESLLRHRPCICGSGGGLAEVARGGGCLQVPEPTPAYLAEAMRTLLNDRSVHDRLIHEAAQRRFSTWADYARQIAAWLADLRPRCPEPVTA
jgi:glycosyltransferase involved in cell wall biosynthesis